MDFKKDITVTEKANSTVKITGEIPFAEMNKHRPKALANLGKGVKIDGWRKGHLSEEKLVQHLGEMAILNEMARLTMSKIYPDLVKVYNLSVIGLPEISITKLAKDNPLGFSISTAVVPEIKLPNYKEIAASVKKEADAEAITDAEVDKQIENIMHQKIAYERIQKKAVTGKGAKIKSDGFGTATELPTPESEAIKNKAVGDGELQLPELTDDYVKSLGKEQQFSSVAEFKKFIRQGLETEKKQVANQRRRARITDAIIDKTDIALPQILIDSETDQMMAQLEEDLKQANLNLKDYLSHLKKTESDLKREWREAAKRRAELQLVLNEIAKVEKIEPNQSELDKQVKLLLEQHKEADEASVRIYVASVMRNELVMKQLEMV